MAVARRKARRAVRIELPGPDGGIGARLPHRSEECGLRQEAGRPVKPNGRNDDEADVGNSSSSSSSSSSSGGRSSAYCAVGVSTTTGLEESSHISRPWVMHPDAVECEVRERERPAFFWFQTSPDHPPFPLRQPMDQRW